MEAECIIQWRNSLRRNISASRTPTQEPQGSTIISPNRSLKTIKPTPKGLASPKSTRTRIPLNDNLPTTSWSNTAGLQSCPTHLKANNSETSFQTSSKNSSADVSQPKESPNSAPVFPFPRASTPDLSISLRLYNKNERIAAIAIEGVRELKVKTAAGETDHRDYQLRTAEGTAQQGEEWVPESESAGCWRVGRTAGVLRQVGQRYQGQGQTQQEVIVHMDYQAVLMF